MWRRTSGYAKTNAWSKKALSTVETLVCSISNDCVANHLLDHLTSFALLLDGGSGGGDPCSSSDADYVLAWISLALVASAITLVTIIIIIFEIRHRREVQKTNIRLTQRLSHHA